MNASLQQRKEDLGGKLWIPAGVYRVGADDQYPEEAPAREVRVDGFWIDRAPVTNLDFADFVTATGWLTTAERPPDPELYPDLSPDLRKPASFVFEPTKDPVDTSDPSQWWRLTEGADWRHPYGPDSNLDELWLHPVVHVSWDDVQAYARWAGDDLPTESEWEAAARGGLVDTEYAWGDEFKPEGRHMANTWQGQFPHQNLNDDGWLRTSPVGAFPPNGYGAFDMIGNVWEWTKDWWSTGGKKTTACCGPGGAGRPSMVDSVDPRSGGFSIPRKVLKGGSHLCAPSYCRRYRPAARHPQEVDTSTSHIGFRCVWRTPGD